MGSQQAALTQRTTGEMSVSGTFSDVNRITAMLERRGRDFHLVSPTTECSQLPEGFSVSFAAILVPESETYPEKQSGKLALHRVALDRIAAAAGISWDAELSGRMDDGRDPHYCMWRAVGHIRQFDSTVTTLPPGSKEMDLRSGSAQALACTENELKAMRRFIVGHAETKARLRVIAGLGIQRAYTREDLKKPFVCARLSFTGESTDPDLRRAFALRRVDALMGGSMSAFGAPPSLPPKALRRGMAPPPVDSVIDVEEDEPEAYSAPASPPPPAPPVTETRAAATRQELPAPPPQRAPAPPAAQTQAPPVGSPTGRSGHTIPSGRNAGWAIEDVDDRELAYWAERLVRYIADPSKARFRDKNKRFADAVNAERDRRMGIPADNGDQYDGAGGPDDAIPF